MKKVVCLVFLMIISSLSHGEDGLVIQYNIQKISDSGQEISSYINAVLMRFDEEHSFPIEDLYEIKFYPRLGNDRHLSLVTTLKEVEDGKPYYVGAQAIDLEIGEAQTIVLERNELTYKIKVDTSYGTIP